MQLHSKIWAWWYDVLTEYLLFLCMLVVQGLHTKIASTVDLCNCKANNVDLVTFGFANRDLNFIQIDIKSTCDYKMDIVSHVVFHYIN